MISIFFGFLLLMQESARSQSTCPDLSGRYVIQGEDGRVFVTIKQTRCERITIEWLISSYSGTSRTTHVLALDGKFHTDTGWFGERGKQLTSAQFRSDTLEILSKSNETRGTSVFGWKLLFAPLPNKDLCTKFFDPHEASWSGRRAGRQKSNTPDDEDEAARRSEEGC
jgi:hypothetical protein